MRSACYVLTTLLITATLSTGRSPAADWAGVKALSPGTEVRIKLVESGAIDGRVESATETALIVDSGKGRQSVDRQQVMRVSVRTRARRKRSLLIGLAVGAAGGLAFGGAAAAVCEGSLCGGHGVALVAGSVAGAAIIGSLIGTAVAHRGWHDIYRK